jgi:hypothetical protein
LFLVVFEKPLGEVFHYEEEQLGNRRNDPAKS